MNNLSIEISIVSIYVAEERPTEAQPLRGRSSSSDDWEASLPPSESLRDDGT